jgi:nucleoid-associated protein EbfC
MCPAAGIRGAVAAGTAARVDVGFGGDVVGGDVVGGGVVGDVVDGTAAGVGGAAGALVAGTDAADGRPTCPAAGPQPVAVTAVSSSTGRTVRRRGRTGPACHPGVGAEAYARCMSFPGGQPDMAQLLQQAQQLQQQMQAAQEELAATEVTGTAGGDLVSATMTGDGELTALTIAPAAVDPDDLETLQDLIVAAVRDARRAAEELAASRMNPLAGGLGGGLGLPGL